MSSVLNCAHNAAQHNFDVDSRRGISTGGYLRLPLRPHPRRVIARSRRSRRRMSLHVRPAWISAQNQMEYPFALTAALTYKFGCRDTDPPT